MKTYKVVDQIAYEVENEEEDIKIKRMIRKKKVKDFYLITKVKNAIRYINEFNYTEKELFSMTEDELYGILSDVEVYLEKEYIERNKGYENYHYEIGGYTTEYEIYPSYI